MDTTLHSLVIGDHPISFQDNGPREAPAVVLMSGWCHDHRLFDQLIPYLEHDLRVVAVDWRGHGADRSPVSPFGYAEQASDTIAVLDELGIEQFLPVSHSHGGWANLEIADRVGVDRAPRVVLNDWLMTPPAPGFAQGLAQIQDPERWIEGRQGLYDVWLNNQKHERVQRHLDVEMSGFGFDLWSLSCKVIEDAYAKFGSPLQRIAQLQQPRPVKHLFSQPTDVGYRRAQEDFQRDHPEFEFRTLGGPTHFPTLDSPAKVAAEIQQYARRPTSTTSSTR